MGQCADYAGVMREITVAACVKQRYPAAALMPIRFTCEVTDPHTEALLRFLEDLMGDNEAHKMEVLSCAMQWLRMGTPTVFNRDDAHESQSLRLVDDEIDPIASSLSQQPSEYLSR
jgi:hypothetical protein